ncbi:MAG TPA: histidine kinase dimerization/phospho-acceptor domain-containing protein, partial [Candidatus Limnocylindrales bacterium]|nr:histidine kinase dimerization/phospho-acceptor domain-containing protein [Candidatus Limnocylindrales bacterium]
MPEKRSSSPVARTSSTATPAASGRAEALLTATNRFLRSDDIDALAEAMLDALESIFGATKAELVLADAEGSLTLVATRGYSPADRALSSSAIRDVSPFFLVVAAGDEVWSDDHQDEALQEQLAAFGAAASFSLPIQTAAAAAGNITAMFEADPGFDDATRTAARHLVSQVGLALDVIHTRDGLRLEAEHARQERRQAAVLLRVAQELATITDPGEIPAVLAAAISEASRASFAAIGRILPDGNSLEFVAGDPLTPAQEALFRQLPVTPAPFPAATAAAAETSSAPEADGIVEASAESLAAAPIVIDGQVWGIVGLGASDERALARDWWAELSRGFASIAATALARAEAVAALARQRDLLASDVEERTLHLTAAVEELQRASDAKTAFLANVSHELRTPLTAILGFVEILSSGMDGPLNQAQAEDIRTVQASSRHLLELIDDLIDVASIESGQVQLALGPVDVEELIREGVETMRPQAGEKGISLEVESVEPGLVAAADHGRFREIVLNLLSNALKFTPSGGRIRVSARTEPEPGTELPMARIDVRDSGIGVAVE